MKLSPLIKPHIKGMTKKIGAFIIDWDETITAKDTLKLVAETAYSANPQFPYPWTYFGEIYMNNYRRFVDNFGDHTTLERELEFQQGLTPVERSSVSKTVELGLFRGMTIEMLQNQADKVEIRDGFWGFLETAQRNQIPITILSVNWTSHIIREVLGRKGYKESRLLNIMVNEFEFDVHGVCTGQLAKDGPEELRTGNDKLRATKQIINNYRDPSLSDAVVYVGDSSTDVLGMLECDYGVMVEGLSGVKTLEKLGIRPEKIESGLRDNCKVYTMDDWRELDTASLYRTVGTH